MKCDLLICNQDVRQELVFTSGMSGRYCAEHAQMFDAEIIEDRFDFVSELNGVRLWACDTVHRVDWPEGKKDHQSIFFEYPAAEACFCQHVEEVDAR